MVKLRFILGLVAVKPLAQHGALEYGSDLHVNERQKIRHYRARSTEKSKEEERQMAIFFTSRGARVNCAIMAMLYLILLEVSRRTRWWRLKYVIVYLARDIPPFVMYCIFGESGSSLLIESTNSMKHLRTSLKCEM